MKKATPPISTIGRDELSEARAIQRAREGDPSEIAEILGRSVGDAKSPLHKARMRLREPLHELQRDKARDERLSAARRRSRSSKASFV